MTLQFFPSNRNFVPFLLTLCVAICVLVYIALNPGAEAGEAEGSDYVTKPVMQDVIYVEPRFSKHIQLERGEYFKDLHADQLLSSVEEIAAVGNVSRIEPHTRIVDGQPVPGLFVFLENEPSMIANQAASNGMISSISAEADFVVAGR
ncbi:MAG: hypothetical protein AAF728_05380 [Cyanobacteria bacterium P01_D01_bin.128]